MILARYAVNVVDEDGYAAYRREMLPILASYGGAFVLDVRVSEVLRGPTPHNRLFTIQFASEERRTAFFADPAYRAVREAHFEAAVSAVHHLG